MAEKSSPGPVGDQTESPAGAQPTPGLPCPGMMNVQSGTIDPSLSVTLSATLDAEAREVTLTWTMGGP